MASERVEKPLQEWLKRVHARMLWAQEVEGIGDISAYAINGRTILVQFYEDEGGWEIYLPSSKENTVVGSIDGAATYLGVKGCAGLL